MGGRSRKVRGGGDGEEEPRTAGGRAGPASWTLSPSGRLWVNKQTDWGGSKPIKSPESAHVLECVFLGSFVPHQPSSAARGPRPTVSSAAIDFNGPTTEPCNVTVNLKKKMSGHASSIAFGYIIVKSFVFFSHCHASEHASGVQVTNPISFPGIRIIGMHAFSSANIQSNRGRRVTCWYNERN